MKFLFFLIAAVVAKTILLTNDDSFASTNIRATYRDLKKAGYDVILVAPVSQRSGWGGKFDLPDKTTLSSDGEFGYVKSGSPSWGQEDDDKNIWYFNGTPSACVMFALEYVIPNHFDGVSIDLVVGGPNEGPNLSSGFYTASGTMSAIYAGLYKGIPGISFSGSDFNNSFFKDSLNDKKDSPANIYSKKVVELTKKVLDSNSSLPNLIGLNVNFPAVGTLKLSCTDPKWELTRMMGSGVFAQSMKYNDTTKLMDWEVDYFKDIQKECADGVCDLNGEYDVYIKMECTATISVFSIDYNANSGDTTKVKNILDL